MNGPSLRPEQAHAAHREPGTSVVLAGAGSGKTTVLTARFVHLVQAHGIPVRRIAALTFTEKAASEMRERIARAIAGSDDPAVKRQAGHVEFAPISTIHAFGARLLREHAIEAGVDPAFELSDETDARLLLEDAWREVERRLRAEDDPRIAVLHRLGGDDPARGLRALHERLRGVDADLEALAWHAGDTSSEAALVDVGRALADLDAAVGESLSSKKGLAPDALRAFLEARARLPEPEALAVGGFEPIRQAGRVAAYAKSMGACLPLPKGVATEARRAVFAAYEQAAAALLQEHGAREVARPVRALLLELDRAYEESKRLRGVLDFGDL